MKRLSFSRRLRALGLGAVAVAAVLTSRAHAQTTQTEEGTIYFGRQPQAEIPTFWVAPLRADLDLKATYTNSKTSSSSGETKITEKIFEETLTLYSQGFIVHPNLVDFRFSVTGGLSQVLVDTDQGSDSASGIIYGWDVSATLFRNQPGNLTLYSRRTESTTDIPFGATQHNTITTTGAVYNYHTVESSLQLEAFHEEETQAAFASDQSGLTNTRDVFRGNGDTHPSENQTLIWNFDIQHNTFDSGGNTSDDQAASGSVGHTVAFGDDKRSSLSSGLSYSRTNGTLDWRDLRWNEHLHLQHTPNFETNYDYTYEQLTFGSATTDRHAAWVDARHQLYKSLITYAHLRGDDVRSGDNATKTYNADLSLNYTKIVPYGLFLADARLGYQQQQIEGSGTLFVPNQPITFVGLDPVSVAQPNAIPASVLIRNALTNQTYVEGVDYTVTQTPLGLRIDRVLGGGILPGQPLLLSYEFNPPDANEVVTTTFGTGARYQIMKGPLAGLSPYARFLGQDQEVSGGTARPESIRDYIAGVDYQYSGLTLRAEREWYDSTLFPYDAWRYEARLSYTLSAETSGSASFVYSDIQYQEPPQKSRSYSLSASLSHRLTTELTASVYGAFADVRSDPGGRTQGAEEGMEINWYHRQTRVYMRLRNSTLETDTVRQDFQFLQVGLTRNF